MKIAATSAPAATAIIRLMVGAVFFLEGVKKFLFVEQWGAGRFTRIGIWEPHFMASFVGVVEIVCGLLVLAGLITRLAAIPLIIDIAVAIAATKIPILLAHGFWPMEAQARTDFSMLCGLVFLLTAGAGKWSLDRQLEARPLRKTS